MAKQQRLASIRQKDIVMKTKSSSTSIDRSYTTLQVRSIPPLKHNVNERKFRQESFKVLRGAQ